MTNAAYNRGSRAPSRRAEIAQRLAAATPGPWVADMSPLGDPSVVDATGRVVLESPLNDGGIAALVLASEAPTDLAWLLAELARVTKERDAAEAEASALRAIVEGRTEAPTEAEFRAITSHGGMWVSRGDSFDAFAPDLATFLYLRSMQPRLRWLPIDREGRPCAWPTVKS
jgi:hypothetical protein